MKEVTISIPKEKTDELTQFLENQIKINSIIFLTGKNCNQFTLYLPQSKVGDLLKKLDAIGCGVSYGLIKISNINALKPVPRQTNTLSFHPGGTLSLEQVYSSIVSNVSLTKDFVAYTFISSMIASLGLTIDSVVMIVASMLLSPIMTPILGISMGLVINDQFLIRKSLKTELLSWVIIFMVGFIIAIPMGNFADEFDWPTEEMLTRGRTKDVIMSVLFAIPSGVAVGLSVTTGGINNFVGVAVAAALVPVLSNSGLLLGHALMRKIYLGDDAEMTDYSTLGLKSLAIFVINIFLICVFTIIIFVMKDMKKFRRTSVNWKFPKLNQENDPSFKSLAEKFQTRKDSHLKPIKPKPNPNLTLEIDQPSKYTEKEIQEFLSDARIRHILKRFFKNQIVRIRQKNSAAKSQSNNSNMNNSQMSKLKKNLEVTLAKQLEHEKQLKNK